MKNLGMNRNFCNLISLGTAVGACIRSNRFWPSLAAVMVVTSSLALTGEAKAVGKGSRLSATAVWCSATQVQSVSIYLYDAEGDAVDVSGTTQFQQPHVIDFAGNIIGFVDSNCMIIDSIGNSIGFIATEEVPAAN